MKTFYGRSSWAVLTCLAVLAGTNAANAASSDPAIAQAILERRCHSCHESGGMSGLDLTTRESLLAGGTRGPSVVPGDPGESLLIQVISGQHELKMPIGREALPPDEVEALASWVRDGAIWADPTQGTVSAWWSFRTPVKTELPQGAENPIDAFLDATLQEKRLEAAPQADRRTLVRRAYFDLHGIPPTPEQVGDFVNDASPNAWPKLVDELLASPRYGERWGRYWLDVVRYADTGGFETDIYFPNAWRYRDYVIKSFNEDKPYDRFVREQIAGDEMWPDDLESRGSYEISEEKLKHLEARIGTGVYTIGPVYHEAGLDGRQLRYEWLTDVVDTTGLAFMGVSVGCARCHDHKFDPITQRDYHRMMGIFSGSEAREEPVGNQMSRFGYYSGYPKLLAVGELKDAVKRIDSAVDKRLKEKILSELAPEIMAAYEKPVIERNAEERELADEAEQALSRSEKESDSMITPVEREERERLVRELGEAALGASFEKATATVLGPAPLDYPVEMTSRGDYHGTGETVVAGFPKVFTGGAEKPVTPSASSSQTVLGRRMALAEWLTAPDHPLTARVMVNRIWQGHFGRGLVATPNDFGKQGEPPTHPELLDWLAVDLRENGWKTKRVHRMMMLSDAYQRESGPHESNAAIDAENRFLWRMNRQRLDAEALRDSVLAASGSLNLEMGGRPVIPPLTPEETLGLWNPKQWPAALDPKEHSRRSVYLYVKRSFPMPMLTTFDVPDSSQSCARRDHTTVAPQALAMLNSAFITEQAQRMADRLREKSEADVDQWINGAWLLALGREPSGREAVIAAKLFDGYQNPGDALPQLALMVLNLNEFLYVD